MRVALNDGPIRSDAAAALFAGEDHVQDPVGDGEEDPALEDGREFVPGGRVAVGEEEIEYAGCDVGYRRGEDSCEPVRLHL